MGILHATYGGLTTSSPFTDALRFLATSGLGAFAAPLVATQFAQIDRWSFHYLVSLGIALSNAVALAMVFRFKGQDGTLLPADTTSCDTHVELSQNV